MKPSSDRAPVSAPLRRGLIALVVIGGAMLAGYGAGRTSRETSSPSTHPSHRPAERSPAGESRENGSAVSKEERARQLTRIKTRVRELCLTGTVMQDWEAERELAGLLAQLSATELSDFFKEVSHPYQGVEIRMRVLNAWAIKDGPAAIEATAARLDDVHLAFDAYLAWGNKDPDAALKWLREGDLSAYAKQQKSMLRMNFLFVLADRDLEKSLNEVPDMDALEKKLFLQRVTASAAMDETKIIRLQEFAASADEGTRNAVEDGTVLTMGSKDPAKGFDYIDGLEASRARKTDLELTLLRAVPNERVAESMDAWAARHPDGKDIPDRMWQELGTKLIFYRDGMRAWMDGMEPGPMRDAFYQHSVRHLVSRGDRERALHYIGQIEDPEQRVTAIRTMHRMWSESNPGEAKTWEESLSESDRKLLE
ncbi:hypothetical protein [Luteolibacter luteus]|uniref:Uncharacterized protein n=1 Tax=Luteolibacter luteus TaxID=2728835 RepID=A0A858RCE2_9BACT|nr:hypothetical protein [Luteolibacter luteus]QJE94392.1 hypothetical protein HHL09_00855 [Luteolibacter luteus]